MTKMSIVEVRVSDPHAVVVAGRNFCMRTSKDSQCTFITPLTVSSSLAKLILLRLATFVVHQMCCVYFTIHHLYQCSNSAWIANPLCVLIMHRFLPLENCPEMTVTLGRVLPDSGEHERKLTTKVRLSCVHSALFNDLFT